MKVAAMLLIYFCLYLLGAVLTDLCLRKWKRTGTRAGALRKFWLIPYTMLDLLPVAGAFLPDSRLKFALAAAGNVWLGFFLYCGGLLLILCSLAGLIRILSRGRIAGFYGEVLCLSVFAGLILWIAGMVHAQDPRTVTYDITLPGDGSGTEDQTYVLLGDLHLSVNSNPRLMQKMTDLILCGHTHAGQIFPGNLVVPFFNENAWGYERLYGADTIVTAGVGYYGPPMRVGTDSEVTVIRIHFN